MREDISVLIVEDEPIIAADLSNQLTKVGITVLDTFDDGESALEFLKTEIPDIIIMDIQLYGDLDGIDVANQVNTKYTIPIIFLTSNTDDRTFKRAKLTYPHAFLSKPFRIKDILRAIELALEEVEEEEDKKLEILSDRIFIRNKDSLEKVLFKNISYIKADGAYTKIYTEDKEFILSQTLTKIEKKIAAPNFLRVHRSHIVNINNVDRITESYLYIKKEKIPLSRGHREELLRVFKTI
ncbi:MAG: DNA-binding LytR/AlgR family response regulator [Saprospiraceae bacterium]|jgi:DNA-binding LytR/AlgR family response regulator